MAQTPAASTTATAERSVFRTCPLCEATCGLEITLHGDRVKRVRGDRDDVFSHGYVCPKGVALAELHDDPDRLRTPLIRTGDTFREASWEEAYAHVANGLKPHLASPGRNSLGAYIGNPSVHNLGAAMFLRPFLKALATRNLYTAATVDQIPKHVASGLLFGDPIALPVPDIDRSDYLLILGANPWESNGSLWTAPDLPGRLRALLKRGGRFVVVDPRRTRTAAHASEHIAIRPGGDAPWLLALAQEIVSAGLARPGRLKAFASGYDELVAQLQAFTPERVAPLCDIDAATTRRIAHELAASPRAAVYARIGAHANRFGTLAAWATEILNFLTGNLDRAGGVMFPRAPHDRVRDEQPGGRGFVTGRWHSRVSGHPEVMGELPAASLAEEIETDGPGQIRALVTVAGNPVLSCPNGKRLDRALGTLDFMVSVDIYLNETTRHADVILPPRSALERVHYDYFFLRLAVRSIARWSEAVLDSDAPDDDDILMRLALIASGTDSTDTAAFADGTLREHVMRELKNPASPIAGCDADAIIAEVEGETASERIVDFLVRTGPFGDGFSADVDGLSLQSMRAAEHGIDLGAMEPRLPGLLSTANASIELFSTTIEDQLSQAAAALDEQLGADLLLIGRREFHSNNSWMHNVASLIERPDRCTLRVHAADAARLGIGDGERVEVRSRCGAVEVPLEIHAEMRPGVVSLPHGYGHDYPGMRLSLATAHAGASANDLVEGEIDGPSGNAVLNGVSVTVSKVATQSAASA